jgi:hypothetical protein
VTEAKPATAARMYDYYLGGTHNFPADRAAAEQTIAVYPQVSAVARANRAFLGRAIRYIAAQGVRQFLDIGSGIPTQGNVHEVVESVIDDGRVVYADIDPVAVAEGMDILEGNPRAIAVHGDLKDPQPILDNPQVRAMLDFDQPVALLLAAVLHFVPDDLAFDVVAKILSTFPSGSFLAISHGAPADGFVSDEDEATVMNIYKRQTATPLTLRPRAGVALFFEGLELVEPGLVWAPQWRPEPTDPQDFVDNPRASGVLVAVGRKP